MEGRSSKAQGSTSATKSSGSSRSQRREVERSEAIPTDLALDVSERNLSSTLTFSREELLRMIRSLNKEVDPASVIAQIEATPLPIVQQIPSIPPPTKKPKISETSSEGTQELNEDERDVEMRMVEVVEQGAEVEQQLHVAGLIEEMLIPTDRRVEEAEANTEEPGAERVVTLEAEQPLLTAEEVERRLATTMSEAERMDLDVVTQEFERGATINERENPTEKVGTSQTEGIATSNTAPDQREVVVVTDEDDETEKRPPSDEVVKPEVAAVRTYQRRPAREETSGMRSEEEPSRKAPRQRAWETMDSPVRSEVGIPRRRRRLLFDE